MRKRILTAAVLFASVGLLGPVLYWIGVNFYIVSGLWPTWVLGVYEYSLGKVWAGIIATISNVMVFSLFGIVAALVRPRGKYFGFCGILLAILACIGYWIHGGNWISYSVFLLLFITLFFVLDALIKETNGQPF